MIILYYRKKVIAQLKTRPLKNVIDQHIRLRENDGLPLWRAPAIKKKQPFFYFNIRTLTREIMRSKDAQRNAKE